MNQALLVLLAVLVPFCLNVLFTPLVIRVADRFKWYDRLNARKIHTGNVSRLGGIGFFAAFFLALLIITLCLPSQAGFRLRFLIPAVGMLMVFGIGIIDDFYELKASLKAGVQFLAIVLVVGSGFMFNDLRIPAFGWTVKLWFVSYPLTVIWIIGIINAINLIDGMDGLAGSISMLIAVSYGIIMFISGSVMVGVVAFALAGSLLGFLAFNRPKAKIFMGDGGAYFLGYMLAVMPIMDQWLGLRLPSLEELSPKGSTSLLHAITLLLIPILDTLTSMIRRIRNGQRISEPDRHHMHHKLLAKGYSPWRILLILGGLQAVLSSAVILDCLVFDLWSGLCIYASWIVVGLFFYWLDVTHHSQRRQK